MNTCTHYDVFPLGILSGQVELNSPVPKQTKEGTTTDWPESHQPGA